MIKTSLICLFIAAVLRAAFEISVTPEMIAVAIAHILILVLVLETVFAPEGYEDESGFHSGTGSTLQPFNSSTEAKPQ
jgi:hypothetical protein